MDNITREVVKELSVDTTIEHISDIKNIMEYSVLITPGLVIDEKLVCSGRVPSKEEVTQLIITALNE